MGRFSRKFADFVAAKVNPTMQRSIKLKLASKQATTKENTRRQFVKSKIAVGVLVSGPVIEVGGKYAFTDASSAKRMNLQVVR
jgi:hypothetical protein